MRIHLLYGKFGEQSAAGSGAFMSYFKHQLDILHLAGSSSWYGSSKYGSQFLASTLTYLSCGMHRQSKQFGTGSSFGPVTLRNRSIALELQESSRSLVI